MFRISYTIARVAVFFNASLDARCDPARARVLASYQAMDNIQSIHIPSGTEERRNGRHSKMGVTHHGDAGQKHVLRIE